MQSNQFFSGSQGLLNNRYSKVKKLGEGSYGTVYLATDMKPEAIKRRVDPKYLAMFQNVEESTHGGSTYASHSNYEDVPMTEEQKQAF